MLHPSYAELIKAVNEEAESEAPAINSRYSIVLATAKRARQLINGRKPLSKPAIDKPLSIAVDELSKGLIKIVPEEEAEELEIREMEAAAADGADETADPTAKADMEETKQEQPDAEQ